MAFTIDSRAPVASVIDIIETQIGNTAIAAATAIADVITPLVTICFGIYIILIAVDMMRGNSSNPVWDLWMRCLSRRQWLRQRGIIAGYIVAYSTYCR